MPTFEQWLTDLYEVMRPDLATTEPSEYCDAESWRSYYEDGDTPKDAWESEKSYWEE